MVVKTFEQISANSDNSAAEKLSSESPAFLVASSCLSGQTRIDGLFRSWMCEVVASVNKVS